MPTHIEQELGIAPATNRIRRWFRKLIPNAVNSLDPLTVNYEVWHAMNRNVRQWPSYQEAPNYVEVYVSPDDWNQYWGIDTIRKEAGVAAYVKARVAEKGYWIAGEPQITVFVDDTIEMGDFDIFCQFAEPLTAEELARQKASLGYGSPIDNAVPLADSGTETNLPSSNQPVRNGGGWADERAMYVEPEADQFGSDKFDESYLDAVDPRNYYDSDEFVDEDEFEDEFEDELDFEDEAAFEGEYASGTFGDSLADDYELAYADEDEAAYAEDEAADAESDAIEPLGAEPDDAGLGFDETEPDADEVESDLELGNLAYEPELEEGEEYGSGSDTAEPDGAASDPELGTSEGGFGLDEGELTYEPSEHSLREDESLTLDPEPEGFASASDLELDDAAFVAFGPEPESSVLKTELDGAAFAAFGPEFKSDFELDEAAFEFESFDFKHFGAAAHEPETVTPNEPHDEPLSNDHAPESDGSDSSEEGEAEGVVYEEWHEAPDEIEASDETEAPYADEETHADEESYADEAAYADEEPYADEAPQVQVGRKADKGRMASLAQQFVELFWGDKKAANSNEQPEDDITEDVVQGDVEQLEFAGDLPEVDDLREAEPEAVDLVEPFADDWREEPYEAEEPAEESVPTVNDEVPDGAADFDASDYLDKSAALLDDDDLPANVDVGIADDGLPAFVPVPKPDFYYHEETSYEYGSVAQPATADPEPAGGREWPVESEPASGPYDMAGQSYEYGSPLDDVSDSGPESDSDSASQRGAGSSAHYVDPVNPGYLYLIGRSAFRLEIHAGDCIGAVRWGEDVPEQVNVRLDADGFPYAEVMQCTIDVHNGRWCVTNHAAHGTRITKATGERYLLGKSEPYPIDPDDILWLGHERPLRVEY